MRQGLESIGEGMKLPYEAGVILRSLAGFRCKSGSWGAIGYIPFGPSSGTAAGSGSPVGSFTGTNNLICRRGVARHTGVRGITSRSANLGFLARRFTAWCYAVGVLAMFQKPEVALVAAG